MQHGCQPNVGSSGKKVTYMRSASETAADLHTQFQLRVCIGLLGRQTVPMAGSYLAK